MDETSIKKLDVSKWKPESQVEVKKNAWAEEVSGKSVGKIGQVQLESNVAVKKVRMCLRCGGV